MTESDIKSYLADNTDLPEEQIVELAYHCYMKLDYKPIYEQIDTFVELQFGSERVRPSAPAQAGE